MPTANPKFDPWNRFDDYPHYPGTKSRIVVPSDANDLAQDGQPLVAKAIMACAAGNVAYIPAGNNDDAAGIVTMVGVPAGWTSPHRVRRVMATGTGVTIVTVDG